MTRRPRILVVDDNPSNRLALRTILKGVNAELHEAGNGFDALSMSLEADYAMIFLDVQMPEMDGYEVCDQLRANPRTANTPVIFLTAAYKEDSDKIRGYVTGATDYLAKPIEDHILRAKVEVFLRLHTQNHLLQERESRIRAMLDTALDAVIGMDAEGRITDWNRRAEAIFGWSKDEVLGLALDGTIIPENSRLAHRRGLGRFLATGEERLLNRRIETIALRRNGEEFPVELAITPLRTGDSYHFTAFIADISVRKASEDALQISHENLNSILETTLDGYWSHDDQGNLLDVNPTYCQQSGYTREELLAMRVRDLDAVENAADTERHIRQIIETGRDQFESRHRRKDGSIWDVEVSSTYSSSAGGQFFVFLRDITARKQLEDEVRQMAFHDPLTKLPNRRLLNDRLSQALATSKRRSCHGALMFFDLDNFKPLNDTRGHEVGDLLLVEAANRTKNCVREIDTVARVGGDEFVVIISELEPDKAGSITQAGIVAEKIRLALAEPYRLTIKRNGQAESIVDHHCTASIGVALFICPVACQDDIYMWADAAMYRAKEAGRNQVRFFDTAV